MLPQRCHSDGSFEVPVSWRSFRRDQRRRERRLRSNEMVVMSRSSLDHLRSTIGRSLLRTSSDSGPSRRFVGSAVSECVRRKDELAVPVKRVRSKTVHCSFDKNGHTDRTRSAGKDHNETAGGQSKCRPAVVVRSRFFIRDGHDIDVEELAFRFLSGDSSSQLSTNDANQRPSVSELFPDNPTAAGPRRFEEINLSDGRSVFVDAITGNSYMQLPSVVDQFSTNFLAGIDLSFCRENAVKLSFGEQLAGTGRAMPDFARQMIDQWQNPVLPIPAASVPLLQFGLSACSANEADEQVRFAKEHLLPGRLRRCVRVLGQVDRKFIAILTPNSSQSGRILWLVDQHAAHERVRLDLLLRKIRLRRRSTGGCTDSLLDSVALEETILIDGSFSSNQLAELERLGFKFRCHGGNVFQSLIVTHVPLLFCDRSVHDFDRFLIVKCTEFHRKLQTIRLNAESVRTVRNFFREQLNASLDSSQTVVNVLYSRLASLACHSAIRFGDQLSLDNCSHLLLALGATDLPFQCAHGRPTVYPLFSSAVPPEKFSEFISSSF